MDPAVLIAQAEHGPQLHGGVVPVVIVAIALVAGLVLVARRAWHGARRRSDRDPGRDRGPEA
jgi:hypothetical protein